MNNNICTKCKYYITCGGAAEAAPCAGYAAITRADILTAIQETRATIETLENAKNEYKNKWRELFQEYKKAARDNGPEAARIGKKMDILKNDENDAAALISDLNTKIAILKNNYRIILFDDVAPHVVAVLKKYDGRQYGPKTREKIRDEIKAAAGVHFYINCRSWCDELIISDEYLRYSGQLEININGGENENGPHVLIDNKINAPEAEQLTMYYNTFVDDPAERVKELKKAYNAAREAQQALKKLCDEYNELTVFGLDHIYAEKHLY